LSAYQDSNRVISVQLLLGHTKINLPCGINLSLHGQAKLSAIARQLNERPRKTLLYQTPAEKFAERVAAIG
jgi:IS30 family transposase